MSKPDFKGGIRSWDAKANSEKGRVAVSMTDARGHIYAFGIRDIESNSARKFVRLIEAMFKSANIERVPMINGNGDRILDVIDEKEQSD